MSSLFAEVLLPIARDAPYSYRVPEGMALVPGQSVTVPLGKREQVGVVWHLTQQCDVPADKLRDITALHELPPFTDSMRAFIDWVAEYTLSPKGMVLRMAMPVPEAFVPLKRVVKLKPAPVRVALPPPPLMPAQVDAAAQLVSAVDAGGYQAFLLDGVTGSGKTEVYFAAITRALEQGKQVLVLLPEIALSTQWLTRFVERFGMEPVVWHSAVTPARKREGWKQVLKGEAKVVVGARSALFLPFQNLGLVVVDEEHDPSYKQEEGVCYHGRDMAVARAHVTGIPIVLASATPSLETLVNLERGRYRLLSLPDRVGGAAYPDVRIVDMRGTPKGQWLSASLIQAVGEVLASGQQSMLFLNRRGYAPLLLCRACGYRFECPDCSTWLVMHQQATRMQCHHCGWQAPAPNLCPACAKPDTLTPCGPGVERVHEEVSRLFPTARVVEMTSDTVETLLQAERTVQAMAGGQIDILIGTQMMAKGYHFPKLRLIGVVDADVGLAGGDLRAMERSYQLLHQIAGRAGREGGKSLALLQTLLPDHAVMQAMVKGDRDAFIAWELRARQEAGMPPFTRLVSVLLTCRDEAVLRRAAVELARQAPGTLLADIEKGEMRVLGPAPAPLYRLRGRYRVRFLCKAQRQVPMQAMIRHWIAATPLPRTVDVRVDVDPYAFV